MVLLPIVERELRVASRRKSTHRIRLWTTLAGLVVSFFFIIAHRMAGRSMPNLGHVLFGILTYYAFGLALLAGVFLAADCVSEEKREGTLGLLFLTDLKGHDVVLGKLMAVGLSALYGLVAVLPVTGLPLLLGGVTGGEYWRISLALINTLFFALAAGILVSTWSRESARAMGNTFVALIVITVGLPILGHIVSLTPLPAGWWCMVSFSPTQSFLFGSEYSFVSQPARYWISLGVSHLFAWLMLLLASWILPRVWQDKPARRSQRAIAANETTASAFNQPIRRAVRRAELLDINPILWLAGNDSGMRRRAWGLTLICAVMVIFVWCLNQGVWTLAGTGYVILFFGFLFKVLIAFQACRFFVEARRNGALEMVMSTPLTSREIIQGQWLALRRIFFWPAMVFLALQLIALLLPWFLTNVVMPLSLPASSVSKGIVSFNGSQSYLLLQCGLGLYQMARWMTDILALGWVGMWLGLSARKPKLAVAMTILFVKIVPTFAFCVPGLVVDIFFIYWARQKLANQFRFAAMPQYDALFANPPIVPSAVPPPMMPG